MKAAKLLMTAAASAVVAGTADAQLLPAAPAAAPGATAFGNSAPSPVLNGVVPPPGSGVGLGPGAQLPGSMNTIWSRLGISQEQREFCKRKICRTPAGALMGRIQAPISTLTGGVIPPFCPITPSVAELLDPGVVGAASKAKLDRAGAEERIKAIKYLATLDCHYWPEAEEALIGALRGDRNECVRYEAAVALARGCCCTCKVIVALSHTVSCSEADGFPYEKSARVRAVAANALDRCMASCNCASPELPCLPGADTPTKTEPEKKPDIEKPKPDVEKSKTDAENKTTAKPGDADYPKVYYTKVAKLPRDQVGVFGRKALEIGANIGYTSVGDVNPRDYAAAGLPSTRDGQSAGAKPTTLWELMTWSNTDASIGKPLIGPPITHAGRLAGATSTVPASQAEKLVPAGPAVAVSAPMPMPTPTPTPALPPAAVVPSPKTVAVQPTPLPASVVSSPKSSVPAAVASRPAADVPVMTLPSAGVPTAPTPAPKPLVVPTLNPTPSPLPVATVPAPSPKPVATVPTPKATVTAAPAKLAPVPPPTLPPTVVPTVSVPQPPVVTPAAPAIDLPPVEKMEPATAPVSNLPPVEKMTP